MSHQDFHKNLRFACNYYPSVSFVCRKIDINRQQFNSYINNIRLPSRYNMKKICDFFGIEEYEFFEPHDVFVEIINGRRGKNSIPDKLVNALIEICQPDQSSLRKYEGNYFSYSMSCNMPRHVVKSIVSIRRDGKFYLTKTIERLSVNFTEKRIQPLFKRDGIFFYNTNRLFIVDYESTFNATPSMTILYPTTRNRFMILPGVRVDLSSGMVQRPFSARVAYQLIDDDTSLRQALRSTGVFHENGPEIPVEIRDMIENGIHPNQSVLTATESGA